jgi:heme oxygenase
MNAVLERLRARTGPLHVRLETTVSTLGLAANETGYRRYLEKLLGFHVPLELDLSRVRGLDALGLEREARSKVPLLRADLAALGVDAKAQRNLGWCTSSPPVREVAAALGALYVVEGATLGGQVLFRELSARMPRTMQLASRYLRVYGAATGTRWQTFVQSLATLESEAEQQLAEQTAAATFEAIETWLLAHGDERDTPVWSLA